MCDALKVSRHLLTSESDNISEESDEYQPAMVDQTSLGISQLERIKKSLFLQKWS